MQLHSANLPSLLGAIALSSGLASSLCLAEDAPAPDPEQAAAIETDAAGVQGDTDAGMVEVRISLPDGRTIIRLEPAGANSARRSFAGGGSQSRTLPDGSRISVAGHAVGGGNSGSSGLRASGSGGNGSAGGSVGGGGSGGSAGGSGMASGVGEKSGSSSGGPGGGVMTLTSTSNRAEYGEASTGASSASGSAQSSSGQGPSESNAGYTASEYRAVHTVGSPRYDDDGATGGQRVEFHDQGMSAAVIGNTVYFNGVYLVNASEPFTVITGTKMGTDSVIMDDTRLSNEGVNELSSFNTGASAIKLGFESDTVVDLIMQSETENPNDPNRTQRVWTVRIR